MAKNTNILGKTSSGPVHMARLPKAQHVNLLGQIVEGVQPMELREEPVAAPEEALPFWHADAQLLDPEGAARMLTLWQQMDKANRDWQQAAGMDVAQTFARLDTDLKKLFRAVASSSGWKSWFKAKGDPRLHGEELQALDTQKRAWALQAQQKITLLSTGLERRRQIQSLLPGAIELTLGWEALSRARMDGLDARMGDSTDAEQLMQLQGEHNALLRIGQACGLIVQRLEKESTQGLVYREMFATALQEEKLAVQHMETALQESADQTSAALMLVAAERSRATTKQLQQRPKALSGPSGGKGPLAQWDGMPKAESKDLARLHELLAMPTWTVMEETRFFQILLDHNYTANSLLVLPDGNKFLIQVMFERGLFTGATLSTREEILVLKILKDAEKSGTLTDILQGIPESQRIKAYMDAIGEGVGRNYLTKHMVILLGADMPTEFAVKAWEQLMSARADRAQAATLLPIIARTVFQEGTRSAIKLPTRNLGAHEQEKLEAVCQDKLVPDTERLKWIGECWKAHTHDQGSPHYLLRALREVLVSPHLTDSAKAMRGFLRYLTPDQPHLQMLAIGQELKKSRTEEVKFRPIHHNDPSKLWEDLCALAEGTLSPSGTALPLLIRDKAWGLLQAYAPEAALWDEFLRHRAKKGNFQPLCELLQNDCPPALFAKLVGHLQCYLDTEDEQRKVPAARAADGRKWNELETLAKAGAAMGWESQTAFEHILARVPKNPALDTQGEVLDISCRIGLAMKEFPLKQILDVLEPSRGDLLALTEKRLKNADRDVTSHVRNVLDNGALPIDTIAQAAGHLRTDEGIAVAMDVLKKRGADERATQVLEHIESARRREATELQMNREMQEMKRSLRAGYWDDDSEVARSKDKLDMITSKRLTAMQDAMDEIQSKVLAEQIVKSQSRPSPGGIRKK